VRRGCRGATRQDRARLGGAVTSGVLARPGVNPRHASSGGPFTNRELADALQAITPGLRLDLLPGRQDGPGDDPYLDITRLTRDTGFMPTFDVAAAVADYVAWRADNPR
jgi:nucleoside-diphosphate-sugar epimerase